MLYNLLYSLHNTFSALNIFRYITFRAVLAVVTSFSISLILGPWVIKTIKRLKVGENIRKQDSARLAELHRAKQDTPTMGGILILLAIIFSTLIWTDLSNPHILIVLLSTIWLGITGFIDDYIKQVKKQSKGLSATAKLTSQILLGLILGTLLLLNFPENTKLNLPFFKDFARDLDGIYIIFVILVIAGASNAVNLTDGLDGLAIGIVVMVALAFSVLSYLSGNIKFSEYLLIPYIKGSGELTVFCASIFGAGLGFLWFNCFPASIFMGDVGSLALGGALGTVALLIRKEMLLAIVGGIFVLEALSVILQVASFRFTKKRIFKIAPLHHHFQFMGWPENKVIVRFWIVAVLLALLTIATLKVR
ncbi:MAG: phospho-N-acetylmuramoyl-pentapeptide-transferase [Candidatus Omnitrophica bacterium]|nr:phospho-N-acetylmuramoyl-pentapeptide-transferase [Candidatus Omnitrophota bacterium]